MASPRSELIRKDKTKEEDAKAQGPLYYLNRKTDYKPIGPKAEDFVESNQGDPGLIFNSAKSIAHLKVLLWDGIDSRIRPKAWRIILQYTPLNSGNEATILAKKRTEYREYVLMNSEEKFAHENDTIALEMIKQIKKDVKRTLPESHVFRNTLVQQSMIRMLLVYSVR